MPTRTFSVNIRDTDTKWLKWAESRCASIAGKHTSIDRESFKNALQVRNVFFADRVFDLLDEDHSGTISQSEMMNGLYLITKGTRDQKIRFFFDVYDFDGNGTIDVVELRELLKTGVVESSVQLDQHGINHLTNTLFKAADLDNDGVISFDEFMASMGRYPDLMDNFSLSPASWLKPQRRMKGEGCISRPKSAYLRNNLKYIVFMFSFFVVNCALFFESVYRYSFMEDANWCFLIARGCGQALNFNCAVIVLLMLRKVLSFMRTTWLKRVLPFDNAILLHKTVGYSVASLAVVHTLGHIGNAFILETYKEFTAVELLFTNTSILPVGLHVGRIVGSAFITGWVLDVVLLILIAGSLSCVRRSGHFEIFFWTHKICYVLFWFLLILHGPRFWCWFLGPAVLFTLEKISDMKIVRTIRFGKTYVKEVNLLPSGVTHLVMTKPRNFKYKAGDYIFIQVPLIANHEWHPFTISSAPEQEDLSLHIRSAGNWTKRLYQHFDRMKPVSRPRPVKRRSTLMRFISQSLRKKQGVPNDNYAPNGGGHQPSPKHSPFQNDVCKMDPTQVGMTPTKEPYSCPIDIDGDSFQDVIQPPAMVKVRRLSYKADLSELPSLAVRQSRDTAEIPCDIREENEDTESIPTPRVNDKSQAKIGSEFGAAGHEKRKKKTASQISRGHDRLFRRITKPKIIFDRSTKDKIQVHMQGPYGTPSAGIFYSDHAVLIGAGIGVTPFASIIQSIMYRYRSIMSQCPNCQHSWVDEDRQRKALGLKKVDFVWLNRNHTAFEWFVDMLLSLENEQSQYSLDRLLDIHLYMTSMQQLDIKNFGLQMALDLVHERENKDLLTGLRTKLQAGRPDWNKLFQKIKAEKKGRVSVYFCGAPALGSIISKHCQQFGFSFHKEHF